MKWLFIYVYFYLTYTRSKTILENLQFVYEFIWDSLLVSRSLKAFFSTRLSTTKYVLVLINWVKLCKYELSFIFTVAAENCRETRDCTVTTCSTGSEIHCIDHQCTCTSAAHGSGKSLFLKSFLCDFTSIA